MDQGQVGAGRATALCDRLGVAFLGRGGERGFCWRAGQGHGALAPRGPGRVPAAPQMRTFSSLQACFGALEQEASSSAISGGSQTLGVSPERLCSFKVPARHRWGN